MKINLKNVSKGTILRTAALIMALINQILLGMGFEPFPYEADELYEIISALLTAITAIWAWWKNNSFSDEAIQADRVMKNIREISK